MFFHCAYVLSFPVRQPMPFRQMCPQMRWCRPDRRDSFREQFPHVVVQIETADGVAL